MTIKRRWFFFAVVALNVAALAIVIATPTRYKVDFSSVLEIWSDVFRDVDRFGLTVTSIPAEREIEIGREVVAQFFSSESDTRQLAYVNAVGSRLAAHARRRQIKYQFHIANAAYPNAFALPGGHVIITSAMLEIINSEAELASVLGHEIAHIDLKHCIENLQYELFAERIVGGQLSQIVGIAYRLAALGFSELQEREADRAGAILMAEANYSPLEAIRLWARMQEYYGEEPKTQARTRGPEGEILRSLGDALGDYFATHPETRSRMSDLEGLIERNLPSWEGQTFYVGRTNYADLASRDEDDRVDERIIFSVQSPAYLQASGQMALATGNPEKAIDFLTAAINSGLSNAENYRARARAYLALDQLDDAKADTARVIELIESKIAEMKAQLKAPKGGDPATMPNLFENIVANYDALLEEYDFALGISQSIDQHLAESRDRIALDRQLILMRFAKHMSDHGLSKKAVSIYQRIYESADFELANFEGDLDSIEGAALALAYSRNEGRSLSWLKELIEERPLEAELYHIRSKVFAAVNKAGLAEREYDRYLRLRDKGVPPLTDEQFEGLQAFWDSPEQGDYKAYAVTEDLSDSYQGTGYRWSRRAAVETKRQCVESFDRPCQIYSLGKNIVWAFGEEMLESAFNEYENEIERKKYEEIAGLSLRIQNGEIKNLLLRGDSYAELGRYELAEKDYSAFIEADPTSTEAYFKRGLAYFKLWEFDRALADFQRAKNAEVAALRGYSRLYLGDMKGALENFKWWAQNGTESPLDGKIGIFTIRLLEGASDEAKAGFRQIQEEILDDAHLSFQACWHLALAARPKAAMPYCEDANRLEGNYPPHLDGLAFAKWQTGDTEAAIELLADAKRIDRTLPEPEVRLRQFATLLVSGQLMLKGYPAKMLRSTPDEQTRLAIKGYQGEQGLVEDGEITDELVGHIALLGFGSFGIREVIGALSPSVIRERCAGALWGNFVEIRVTTGEHYQCNADTLSVRQISGLLNSQDQGQPEN